MTIKDTDLQYLRRAIALAGRARGCTSPNPMVGAVVVKDGVVVGEGYHRKAGGPHAEIFALRAAGEAARGGTAYVSLEPCCHHGKTPPCTDALIAAGVARVVFASTDIDARTAGKSAELLRQAGMSVEYGALSEEEQRLNEAWRHWMSTRMPFTTVKLAASLDGKIATRTGDSQWITGAAARRDVHRLRAAHDAILTTAATVCCDNPALTARLRGAHQPRRVVVDAQLRTAPEANVYASAECAPILATAVSDPARLAPFLARGVEVLMLPDVDGGLDLPALMRALGEREIASLMVEAGGRFAGALFDARLVQKLRLYFAPMLIGGVDAPSLLAGLGIARLAEAPRLRDVTWRRVGEDMRVEGYVAYP